MDYQKYLIEIRRHLHMNPEIGFETKNTVIYIEKKLTDLGFETTKIINGSGLIAKLNLGFSNTIGFRADIDALNICEQTTAPFKSKNNYMHACGHDAHSAMLICAAAMFMEHKDTLKNNIVLIFQPAEEGPLPGGSLSVIETGLLNDCSYIFGGHVTNALKTGEIGFREHLCPAPDLFTAKFYGAGCHASTPEFGANPILAMSETILGFEKLEKKIKNENMVVSTTYTKSGNTFNAIPEYGEIRGTARSFTQEKRDMLEKTLSSITKECSSKNNVNGEFIFHRAYDPLINDLSALEIIKSSVLKNNELTCIELKKPVMFGEDFSHYKRIAKIGFVLIGVRGVADEFVDLHSPCFHLDENALLNVSKTYLNIACSIIKDNTN